MNQDEELVCGLLPLVVQRWGDKEYFNIAAPLVKKAVELGYYDPTKCDCGDYTPWRKK